VYCIEGVKCSTSRPDLLYVPVAFLTTLSIVLPSVEGLTYTRDVCERFFLKEVFNEFRSQ